MIGPLIGPGGKNIRQIVKESGAEINIEDDGTVTIAAVEKTSADAALRAIQRLTESPEIGKVYSATVKKIMEFGAFVEILPGKEGLVHISQLAVSRVNKVEDIVKLGDTIEVKLINIDNEGRLVLSRKALLPGGENAAEEIQKRALERKEHGPRERGGHDRPRRS